MRFTVLGKSPAWQDRDGACSSYLLETGGESHLIDCGNGAFAKLRAATPFERVAGVVITHVHADHVLDLVPYGYALTLGLEGGSPRPPLWLPPGGLEQLRRIVSVWGSDTLIDEAFDVREYETGVTLQLGEVEARLHEVPHYTLTHAVELIDPGGGRLVYGSDGRRSSRLELAAVAADVLIAEATLPETEGVPLERRGHMSAEEAGMVASAAGVGRLVLTHISDMLDPDRALAAARSQFGGPVEIAAEGSSWEL